MRSTKLRGPHGYADSIALAVIATVLVIVAVGYALSNLGKGHTPQSNLDDTDSATPSAS